MTAVRPLTRREVAQLTVSTEPWLSCDDCFEGVDVFVEDLLTGHRPAAADFRAHLTGCSVCREEATSLATLVAPAYDVDPATAEALIDALVGPAARA